MPKPSTAQESGADSGRRVELHLDGFALEALEQESARMGIPSEEIVTFAVLYYLADLDSGRVSREILTSPYGPELTD